MKKNTIYENLADDFKYLNFIKRPKNNDYDCPHFHKNTEIAFVVSGEQCIAINGESRMLTAGEIAVINSYDVHYYQHSKDPEVLVLLLGESAKKRFSAIHPGELDSFLPVCEGTAQIFEVLLLFYRSFDRSDELLSNGYIDVIMALLARFYPVSPRKKKCGPDIVPVLRYLNDNFRGSITLEALSRRFGYTRNHFSTLFNRVTGMCLTDYVNRLRLQETEQLIKDNPGIPITKIVLDSGFGSLNTYYRTLKKFSATPVGVSCVNNTPHKICCL